MLSQISVVISSPRVFTAVRILLGAVFVWASLSKITNPQGFAEIIHNYHVLPAVLVNPVAIVLPWFEASCGLALIGGRLVRGSALIFVGLMSIFIVLTVFNIYRGLDVNCGCFSVAAQKSTETQWGNLLRNLVFLGLGLFVLLRAAPLTHATVK